MKHVFTATVLLFLIAALPLPGCKKKEPTASESITLPANHQAVTYAGYIHLDLTADRAAFDRPLHYSPYHVDSPCTSISLQTDSPAVAAILEYPSKAEFEHDYTGPYYERSYGSVGNALVDGQPRTTFTRPSNDGGQVTVNFPTDTTTGMHHYEIILPYSDKIYFKGFIIHPHARVEPVPQQPRPRYVAYGASITQGFYASDAIHTWPYILARNKNWQLISMGFAGRCATASDGPVLAALKPDILTIMMGAGDALHKIPIPDFRRACRAKIRHVLRGAPKAKIYVLTAVNIPGYQPGLNEITEPYRKALRDLVAQIDHPNLICINGPELVPNEMKYFPDDGIHPGDLGFATIAKNLADRINP